jgi:putative transposase
MAKGKHSEVEIIGALKQMEAGQTAEDVGREMGGSKHTIYAWKGEGRPKRNAGTLGSSC